MNKDNKKILKNIARGNDLEFNLPIYANNYMSATYVYSLIHLILNYYTIKEIQDDNQGISNDAFLSETVDKLHTYIYQTMLAEEVLTDYEQIVEELHKLRIEMTRRMTILTAYTDALQIYEYVLNRIEYTVKQEHFEVDETELAAKVFQYLFHDNDKMVVNSKIQMVTGQLPIRMTKNRFFDYLSQTLDIYNGSEQEVLDDFVKMLQSTALLILPDGFYDTYKEIGEFVTKLQNTDYKNLSFDEYQEIMEQFTYTTEFLTELVSTYLLVTEIINDLYAAVLAMPYELNESEVTSVCMNIIKGVHDAFISETQIPESVNDGFMQIEGVQEELGEDILQYESVLNEVLDNHKETISWIMVDKMFHCLSLISKLMSNSLFIDLDKKEGESGLADADYISKKKDALILQLTEFFDGHTKEVNRAVMASLFSNMPVLFNSQQEIKEYIEYSLYHCSNQGELMACAKILEDIMAED